MWHCSSDVGSVRLRRRPCPRRGVRRVTGANLRFIAWPGPASALSEDPNPTVTLIATFHKNSPITAQRTEEEGHTAPGKLSNIRWKCLNNWEAHATQNWEHALEASAGTDWPSALLTIQFIFDLGIIGQKFRPQPKDCNILDWLKNEGRLVCVSNI